MESVRSSSNDGDGGDGRRRSGTGYLAISSGGQSRIDGSGSTELLLNKTLDELNESGNGEFFSSERQEHKSKHKSRRKYLIGSNYLDTPIIITF
jgi:hypothetical protein